MVCCVVQVVLFALAGTTLALAAQEPSSKADGLGDPSSKPAARQDSQDSPETGAEPESSAPPEEEYRSPFDTNDEEPSQSDDRTGGSEQDEANTYDDNVVRLRKVRFENRVYFKETTVHLFLEHPVPGPLDLDLLEEDAMRVQAKYKARGYLHARVRVVLEDGGSAHEKTGVFYINAGEQAELREVEIVGGRRVEPEPLQEGFLLKPSKPFDFLSLFNPSNAGKPPGGIYHKPSSDRDEQQLLKNYYAKGYLDAQVVGHRLTAQRDFEGLSSVFDVDEGAQYEIAGIVFKGDLPEGIDAKSLRESIALANGDVCNVIELQVQVDAALNGIRDAGYPFVSVTQEVEMKDAPSGEPSHRGIAFAFQVDLGGKANVGEVKVTGNNGFLSTVLPPGIIPSWFGTFDYVIAQELEFSPGDQYSLERLKESQRRLMRLGLFTSVEVAPVATDSDDIVDVEVKVAEAMTLLPVFMPAVTANEGGILFGQVVDRNVFGTGIVASLTGLVSARLNPNVSTEQLLNDVTNDFGRVFSEDIQFQRTLFDFSLQQPRVLGLPWSLGAEIHRRQIRQLSFNVGSAIGGGVNTSYRLFWDIAIGAAATVEYAGVSEFSNFDAAYTGTLPSSALLPKDVFRNVIGLFGQIDKRDSIYAPRNGVFFSTSLDYAGALTLSGLDMVKAQMTLKGFWTPLWGITFKSNTKLGVVVNPFGEDVPATDRFFLGGIGSIRGFFPRSITPQRRIMTSNGEAELGIGGTRMFSQNTEVEFPFFDGSPVRGILFADFGNAWDDTEPLLSLLGGDLNRKTPILPLGMYFSGGLGVTLTTAMLPYPMRFEVSVPLTRRDIDRPFDFWTGVGSSF